MAKQKQAADKEEILDMLYTLIFFFLHYFYKEEQISDYLFSWARLFKTNDVVS